MRRKCVTNGRLTLFIERQSFSTILISEHVLWIWLIVTRPILVNIGRPCHKLLLLACQRTLAKPGRSNKAGHFKYHPFFSKPARKNVTWNNRIVALSEFCQCALKGQQQKFVARPANIYQNWTCHNQSYSQDMFGNQYCQKEDPVYLIWFQDAI